MSRSAKRKLTVPFGLRDGRLWFVGEVPAGLACGCVCPECGERLVARNKDFEGRKRIRHFQHAGTSTCPGGVETAVHRMAKQVLAGADAVLLPRWASGDVVIEPERLTVRTSRLEVPLLDGAARPDAVLQGVAGTLEFGELCVEIRVHHAVDDAKRQLLASHGKDALEIDLSSLDDETIADQAAFRRSVLETASNRTWINLAHGPFVAERSGRAVILVLDTALSERVIPTKTGSSLTVLDQQALLIKPGSCEPVRIQIPDATVGESAEPYPLGLHTIALRSFTVGQWGNLRLRYKLYLDQIQMNPAAAESIQRGLFEASTDRSQPGFHVRERDWKGYPGL